MPPDRLLTLVHSLVSPTRRRCALGLLCLLALALAPLAHAQPALRSVVLPGAGGHPIQGQADLSHGWMIVQAGTKWSLIHVPPRVDTAPSAQGPLSASGGSVRLVTSFTTPPVAIAAAGDRLYMVLETVDRSGRVSRREVRSVTVARSGLGGLWRFDPEGELYTHPLLPPNGQLLGLAAPGGKLAALIDDSAEANPIGPQIGLLDGNRWIWSDVPKDIAGVMASAPGRVRLVPLRAGAGLCVATLDGRIHLWTAVCTIQRPDRKFTFGQEDDAPILSDNSGPIPPAVSWRWSLRTFPMPDSSRIDPANGTLIECGGAPLWIHASPQGTVDLSALSEQSAATLAVLDNVTLPISLAELEGDGRIVMIWSQVEAPPTQPTRKLESSTPRRTYEVREISAATGRILYQGPAKSMGPVSPDDLRILWIVLLVTMAMALFLVLRPDPTDGVINLPEHTFLAEPGRRLVAALADAVIAWWVATGIWGIDLGDSLAPANMLGGTTLLVAGSALCIGCILGTLGEWRSGRSLGKILAGCEVMSIHPTPAPKIEGPLPRPTLWCAFKRNAIKWFLPPVAMLGIFDHQGRHRADMMARTAVVIRVEPMDHDDGFEG